MPWAGGQGRGCDMLHLNEPQACSSEVAVLAWEDGQEQQQQHQWKDRSGGGAGSQPADHLALVQPCASLETQLFCIGCSAIALSCRQPARFQACCAQGVELCASLGWHHVFALVAQRVDASHQRLLCRSHPHTWRR